MAPARPQPHTAQAVERLRHMVFSGELAAGTDHLESELAQQLGMSRTPVREALLTLQAQGLVEVRPRHGVRVCPISPADMAEIYDVLTELESLAAAHAAGRGHDAAALAPLARAIEQMEQALTLNDRVTWARADDVFHTELVRLGGNSRVIAIVALMQDQVRRARQATLYMRPLPTRSNAEHRGVYDAIARGHAELARDLHRAHRKAAKAMILSLLERRDLTRL